MVHMEILSQNNYIRFNLKIVTSFFYQEPSQADYVTHVIKWSPHYISFTSHAFHLMC